MKIFILKSISFFIIITFGIIIINKYAPQNPNLSNYTAAIIDKHNRIDNIKSPKIIFAGGSNLAFGLDSQKIETELSMPAVNLGLHAGFGLSFMINELKHTIKNGDIVFISPEYFLEKNGDYRLKKKTSDFYKPAELFYDKNLFEEFNIYIENTDINLKSIIDLRNKNNKKQPFKVYSRESFNQYGDVVGHLENTEIKEIGGKEVFQYRYWEGIEKINDFYEFAKKKNVKVFFLYPDFLDTEYYKNKNAIDKMRIDLEKNLKTPIINKPTDFIFDKNFFYDTVYHLNKKGRAERTKRLINILKNSVVVHKNFFHKTIH